MLSNKEYAILVKQTRQAQMDYFAATKARSSDRYEKLDKSKALEKRLDKETEIQITGQEQTGLF